MIGGHTANEQKNRDVFAFQFLNNSLVIGRIVRESADELVIAKAVRLIFRPNHETKRMDISMAPFSPMFPDFKNLPELPIRRAALETHYKISGTGPENQQTISQYDEITGSILTVGNGGFSLKV